MITLHLFYSGENDSARRFVDEMESSGLADRVRQERGNMRYEYYQPVGDPKTMLLIDSWVSQEAIDAHQASPMMKKIAALREKYDLHMRVERFVSEDLGSDAAFVRE